MPGNDLARQIKEHLTARQVVELYGFHPDRGGYIQCPFHAGDNHGSLKVYDGEQDRLALLWLRCRRKRD